MGKYPPLRDSLHEHHDDDLVLLLGAPRANPFNTVALYRLAAHINPDTRNTLI